MAKAKARTQIIRLLSTAGTGAFYTTTRLRSMPEKLQRLKYDWVIKRVSGALVKGSASADGERSMYSSPKRRRGSDVNGKID